MSELFVFETFIIFEKQQRKKKPNRQAGATMAAKSTHSSRRPIKRALKGWNQQQCKQATVPLLVLFAVSDPFAFAGGHIADSDHTHGLNLHFLPKSTHTNKFKGELCKSRHFPTVLLTLLPVMCIDDNMIIRMQSAEQGKNVV